MKKPRKKETRIVDSDEIAALINGFSAEQRIELAERLESFAKLIRRSVR